MCIIMHGNFTATHIPRLSIPLKKILYAVFTTFGMYDFITFTFILQK